MSFAVVNPTVCAVMLTADRPEMSLRAVECFRAQTYGTAKRMLLILDSGDPSWFSPGSDSENEVHLGAGEHRGKTIGALRNIANECASAAVLINWDSDDWSHPNRIAEQVAMLQFSGKSAVGYREALFWDTTRGLWDTNRGAALPDGEAWLYSNGDRAYCLCSSLCYWREAWENRPFPDTSKGEGLLWFSKDPRIPTLGVSAMEYSLPDYAAFIATIHGGNTSSRIEKAEEWRRVPEWDEHCRGIFG